MPYYPIAIRSPAGRAHGIHSNGLKESAGYLEQNQPASELPAEALPLEICMQAKQKSRPTRTKKPAGSSCGQV